MSTKKEKELKNEMKLLENRVVALEQRHFLRNPLTKKSKNQKTAYSLKKIQELKANEDDKRIRTKQIILEKTAGALKGKIPRNLVSWQQKIRSEWDDRST